MGAAASSDAKSDCDEGFVTVRARHSIGARGETARRKKMCPRRSLDCSPSASRAVDEQTTGCEATR
jgi:hypothetical protein